MIFKVLYQKDVHEVPVRENTQAMYIEADSEQDVRQALKGKVLNIEFIQPLEGAHLEYEQASEHFVITEVDDIE
ncbi:DNA-dependent RNA polymerase subunit epsilon [Savagea faecisuis]|uniref:DNA-directed RNA polymerase subunit epsilon n=1 Tax=Savagea faecisuis TaxID=1274803 RepID=A0ABW3H4Y8_9BACL